MGLGLVLAACAQETAAAAAPVDAAGAAFDATPALVARSEGWLRDHDCALSCHTTHAFMVAADHLGPAAVATRESIVDEVAQRVGAWDRIAPWYGGSPQKTAESWGTEAILNAFALTKAGHADAPQAIEHLVATQRTDGGWDWLDFGLAPWEDADAEVAGTALAAVAIGRAQGVPTKTVDALRGFLRRAAATKPAIHNAIALLWAHAAFPDALPAERARTLTDRVRKAQRRDGSWSGDAYQTAFATFVLAKLPETDDAVAAGRTWLRSNQTTAGTWEGRSLNNNRDAFKRGLATDAATAFAVAALATPQR